MKLREKLKKLPNKPGVYLMKDSLGNIIYVGKSKKLANRIGQYFKSSYNHSTKIIEMINNVKDFDIIVTDTELDALLLECRLIKEIRPMYNSRLKNDKSYPYIKITMGDDYPKILVEREKQKDGSVYFGPYTSLGCVERTIEFIKENFPIRKCKSYYNSKNTSRCLNYNLGSCMGVCMGLVSREMYMKRIEDIILLLQGEKNHILTELKNRMNKASIELDFKNAAKYRDQLRALNHVLYRQKVVDVLDKKEKVVAIEIINHSYIKLFLFMGIENIYEEIMELKSVNQNNLKNHIRNIIYRYFSKENSHHVKYSNEDIDKGEIIYSYFRNKKSLFYFKVPESLLLENTVEIIDNKLEKVINKIISYKAQKTE